MSCYWDIICTDCNVPAGITNANHAMKAMQLLISHVDVLAAVGVLRTHPDIWDIELGVNNIYIPIAFFHEHKAHHLRPIDEFGRFDTPCTGTFWCVRCAKQVQCEDREHPQKLTEHIHYVDHIGHWSKG
jgi:hypothetical protein